MTKAVKLTMASLISVFAIFLCAARSVYAQSSIYLSPSQGAFELGSTFDVSFLVNTGGSSINAVQLDVTFPPDKLQVVNPNTGGSFISLWVAQPRYSNKKGTATFRGGVPSPGINTSAGRITTITFRVKAVGKGTIAVKSTSKVLANDGVGTDVLTTRGSGTYTFTLPAPEGPIITSGSHSDPSKWYRDNNVTFSWRISESVLGAASDAGVYPEYSWSFNHDPTNIPDNTPEGSESFADFTNVESGIWYFHVKSRVGKKWGQTSHFMVKIDRTAPASFTPVIDPETGSEDIKRLVMYDTTDSHSGIDHYEVKIESLFDTDASTAFFIEQSSPWHLDLLPSGEYRVIARAYDEAGNYTDGQKVFGIQVDMFYYLSQIGITVGGVLIPWWVVHLAGIIAAFLILFFFIRRRRKSEELGEDVVGYITNVKEKLHHDQELLEGELEQEKKMEEVLDQGLQEIMEMKGGQPESGSESKPELEGDSASTMPLAPPVS